MYSTLRHVLIALITLAFLGGSVQATPLLEGAGGVTADMPCDHMAAMHGMMKNTPGQDVPCKGLTPECVKQMGCVTIPALAERFAGNVVSVSYTRIVYWSPASDAVGLSRKPDLLPPRAI